MPIMGINETVFAAEIVSEGNAASGVALAALGLCTLLIKVVQSNISNDREDRRLEREVREQELLAAAKIQEALHAQTQAVRELTSWLQSEFAKKVG